MRGNYRGAWYRTLNIEINRRITLSRPLWTVNPPLSL
jgi:hypothetical protein